MNIDTLKNKLNTNYTEETVHIGVFHCEFKLMLLFTTFWQTSQTIFLIGYFSLVFNNQVQLTMNFFMKERKEKCLNEFDNQDNVMICILLSNL